MSHFKPGTKVVLTEQYKIARPDLAEEYRGVLVVSSVLCMFDEGFRVFRNEYHKCFLPSIPRIFRLADPIWLKQKDK